jgi:hypothetical protein
MFRDGVYMPVICKRCLLNDRVDAKALAERLNEWIACMPPDSQTPSDIYTARLHICTACGHQADGLCGLCGCYVEWRAAHITGRCPDTQDRWDMITGVTERPSAS